MGFTSINGYYPYRITNMRAMELLTNGFVIIDVDTDYSVDSIAELDENKVYAIDSAVMARNACPDGYVPCVVRGKKYEAYGGYNENTETFINASVERPVVGRTYWLDVEDKGVYRVRKSNRIMLILEM